MMTGSEFEFPEPAIRARVQEWALDAPGTGLVWLNSALVAAGGDGRLHFVAAADDGLARPIHQERALRRSQG